MKLFFILVCATVSIAANAQQAKQIRDSVSLTGNEKWDYLNVNNKRLFVSHGNRVQVVDLLSKKEIKNIAGLSGVHGIAIDDTSNYGFISNGMQNNVIVFDNKTYAVIDSVPTGKKPDAIVFEPFTETVVVGNGVGNSLTVIDSKTLKVKATIGLEGNPEYIVSDKKGMAYVNIEDKSEIAIIDMQALQLKGYIQLKPAGEEPTGLAIDTKQGLLFAGCGNEKLLVIAIGTQKVIATLSIGKGCDGVAYNPSTHCVYASNKEGTLSVIHQKGKSAFEVMPSVKTRPGCKTLAVDEENDIVYVPTSMLVASKKNAGKTDIVPNSFKVFVIR